MDTCSIYKKKEALPLSLLPIFLLSTFTTSDYHKTNKHQDLNILAPKHNLFLLHNSTPSLANHIIQKKIQNMARTIECLANASYLKDLSAYGLSFPPKQPSTQSSSHGTSPSLTNEAQSASSTPKTTPENSTHEDSTSEDSTPEDSTPENATLEWTKKWYRSLSRVDQLEYLVKIKIDTFREHVRVHVLPFGRQWCIDEEENRRRRKFYEKKGEEAYWARYIDSNYAGHVEFLYVDPKKV